MIVLTGKLEKSNNRVSKSQKELQPKSKTKLAME